MENQNRDTVIFPSQSGVNAISKNFVANVFLWMFLALGLSAAFAYLFASSDSLLSYLVYADAFGRGHMSILGYIVMFAPIGFVLLMSFGYQRLSAPAIISLFLAYAVINGISFSFILRVYSGASVVACFASAALMFGVMAVMGYTTNQDLTKFGRILIMGLFGIIIASLVNFFLHSDSINYIVSILGVMIFTGLTAYDVQKLKRIGAGLEFNGVGLAETKKLSIIGALNLYLDFINIFLFLLRLFGSRKD